MDGERETAEETARDRLEAGRERRDRVDGAVGEARSAAATARDEGVDQLPPAEEDEGRHPDVVYPASDEGTDDA